MDYLIGKLLDQTEVQITIESGYDHTLKPTMISTLLLFTIDRRSIISDAIRECANVFRHVFVPKDNILNI